MRALPVMSNAEMILTPQRELVYKRHNEDCKRMDAFIKEQWPTAKTDVPVDDRDSYVTLQMSTSLHSSVLLLAVGLDSLFTRNTLSKIELHPWLFYGHATWGNGALIRHITAEWQRMVVPNDQRRRVDTIAKHIIYDFSDDKKAPEMIPFQCDERGNVRVVINDLEIWSHPRRDEPLNRVLEQTKGFTQDRGYFVKTYPNKIRNIKENDQIKDKEKRLTTAREEYEKKLDIFYRDYYCKLEAENRIPTSYEFPTLQLALETGDGQPSQRYGDSIAGGFLENDNEVHQKFPVDKNLQKWPLPTKEEVSDQLLKCAESVYKDVCQYSFFEL